MSKSFLIVALLSMIVSPVFAETAPDQICARVSKGSATAQLIPVHGKTKIQLKEDENVAYGAMIMTQKDPVWIEMNDMTVFKIAPNSFFEISSNGKKLHQLYRGEVLVSAPPSIREFQLSTPNSKTDFSGGVVLIRYAPAEKETTVAVFNRKVTLRNKFNSDAHQVVSTGEMSKLWIGESRIIPSQPEVMSASSVKSGVSGFGISADETNEFVAIVTRVTESRAKSLVADLEEWEEIEKESDAGREAKRSVASVPHSGKHESSIDPVEAKTGLELLKKHLYGDEEDQKMFEDSRKPASTRGSAKIKDVEYQRKKAKEHSQVKKVLEEIRSFDPEND